MLGPPFRAAIQEPHCDEHPLHLQLDCMKGSSKMGMLEQAVRTASRFVLGKPSSLEYQQGIRGVRITAVAPLGLSGSALTLRRQPQKECRSVSCRSGWVPCNILEQPVQPYS